MTLSLKRSLIMRMRTNLRLVQPLLQLGSFVLVALSPSFAEIRLPNAISDHAVLQRGVPIHLWGWATPGAQLTISLKQQAVVTSADHLGEWEAWLMPEAAGGPYTLTVQGDAREGKKSVSDLWIGDVWLASGQSNMDIPLRGYPGAPIKNGPAEIAAATVPMLRILHVGQVSSDYPLDDIKDKWSLCTPETAANTSAVAYFFGREIAARENVPVGLIVAAWGGVPVDSYISLQGLSGNLAGLAALSSRASFADGLTRQEELKVVEGREDAAARVAGTAVPSHAWHPDGPSWVPAGPYNGMIAPLTKYSIKGFLWYQGETDTHPDRALNYKALFEILIDDWRSHFAQGDLPFLYAQLSSYNSPHGWGVVRDAQRRALSIRNTAMAVTLDVGEAANIHPADKQSVAARLALAARKMMYGEEVSGSSPVFRQATQQAGMMRVWFDNAKGLTPHGQKLDGFEVAGEDHRFLPADAVVDGETVVAGNSSIRAPIYVRYAWSGVAPPGLYNSDGLPVGTFTSEATPAY